MGGVCGVEVLAWSSRSGGRVRSLNNLNIVVEAPCRSFQEFVSYHYYEGRVRDLLV
jgi:hypothetical protein